MREMPTHHRVAWVSPNISLPSRACTHKPKDPKFGSAHRSHKHLLRVLFDAVIQRDPTAYRGDEVGCGGSDGGSGRGGAVSESFGEGGPHNGVAGEQQASTQQPQGDMQLKTHWKRAKSTLRSLLSLTVIMI